MQTNLFKDNITTYLPGLISLIGDDKDFGWTKINSLFENLLADRKNKATGDTITISTTLFDVIVLAQMKNLSATLLLDLYNSIFSDLSQRLSDKEKKLLQPTIKNILKSQDNRYTEFIGELAVLNNLTITGLYQLHKVERRLPNGKSTDFCLILKSINEEIHVEVYNIHLDPDKVSNQTLEIEKFLINRINKKIDDKSKNLLERDFFVIPIVHGRIESLMTYSHHFVKKKLGLKGVAEPLAFLTFTNPGGNYTHRFGKISGLLYSDEESVTDSNETYIDGV